jgi:hypothetical protein
VRVAGREREFHVTWDHVDQIQAIAAVATVNNSPSLDGNEVQLVCDLITSTVVIATRYAGHHITVRQFVLGRRYSTKSDLSSACQPAPTLAASCGDEMCTPIRPR